MTLRVILEIVPRGNEDQKREIGRLDIFRKGKIPGVYNSVEYGVVDLTPEQEGYYTTAIPRYHDEGAWELVRETLEAIKPSGP